MSQPYEPFTYIPLTNITLTCPECGVDANFMTCLPHPDLLKTEIRKFTCKDCGKQSEITVQKLAA